MELQSEHGEMSLSELYAELKGWQSGLAAIIGFGGLIIGALYNFRLNRKRDENLRKQEMISVAVAIYGEMVLLREEVAQLARIVANTERGGSDPIDAQFLEDNRLPEPEIYSALAAKLGLLPPNLLMHITKFYNNLQRTRTSLPLLVERTIEREELVAGGTLKRRQERRVFHPATVLEPAIATVDDAKPALRLIEALAGIPLTQDPKMGLAREIVKDAQSSFGQQDSC